MGRSVLEELHRRWEEAFGATLLDGPRLGLQADADFLAKIEEGLADAGYEPWDREQAGERRYRHPGGSVARVFRTQGFCYVYPPGGTDRQTGPIHPFSPLERECADANERAGFAAPDASADGEDGAEDPTAAAGSGDPPPDDSPDTEDTDGDDD